MTPDGPLVGQTIDRYTFVERIGRGASSQVYLAEDNHLRRQVAVKAFERAFLEGKNRYERVRREARLHARLEHAHVVRVYDLMESDGQLFLVLRYLEGASLHDMLEERGGPLDVDELRGYLRQILEGLGYAHDKGLVHLDVKPHNLHITPAGEALIVDFGVACMVEQQDRSRSKLVAGSPAYMAPEQAQGRFTDARSDIYALGMTIYELLAGTHPFENARSLKQVLQWQVKRVPRPLMEVNAQVPAEISSAVMRALAKRPRDRFRSCREFGEAMRVWGGAEKERKAADDTDKRWDPRGDIELPARVYTGDGLAFVEAQTINLSASGVALQMAHRPSRGAVVRLETTLPGDGGGPLSARGEVMWLSHDEPRGVYTVGLRFLDLPDPDQQRIARVVRELLVLGQTTEIGD